MEPTKIMRHVVPSCVCLEQVKFFLVKYIAAIKVFQECFYKDYLIFCCMKRKSIKYIIKINVVSQYKKTNKTGSQVTKGMLKLKLKHKFEKLKMISTSPEGLA